MLAEPNEEHVAGDDPSLSSKVGIFDLARNGHRVRVRYKDQHVYCEVYRAADGSQEVHWMCPRCHGGARGYMSRIPSSRKQIDFDPARMTQVGGELNVEAFVCPWELGEDRRQDFGIGLCKLALAIDRSVAKEI
jgi:hypothetical protein